MRRGGEAKGWQGVEVVDVLKLLDMVYNGGDGTFDILHSGIAWRLLFCDSSVNMGLEDLRIQDWIGSGRD